jgi:hypothetical protein
MASKPSALILCLHVAVHHVTNNFILSACGPLDESRTSQARRKGTSRRTEQDRVVKDKSGEDNPGSSHVRGNMQYCRRK